MINNFLEQVLEERMNILITGGTTVSRNSVIQELVDLLPNYNRGILVGEDNIFNIEEKNIIHLLNNDFSYTSSHLFKMADMLKATPIIFPEVRREEAILMLIAMTGGHTGFISVDEQDWEMAINKLEEFCLYSNQYFSIDKAKGAVVQAVDLIIESDPFSIGGQSINRVVWNQRLSLEENVWIEIVNKSGKELKRTHRFNSFKEHYSHFTY